MMRYARYDRGMHNKIGWQIYSRVEEEYSSTSTDKIYLTIFEYWMVLQSANINGSTSTGVDVLALLDSEQRENQD